MGASEGLISRKVRSGRLVSPYVSKEVKGINRTLLDRSW